MLNMKCINRIFFLIVVLSVSMLLGCGSSGGDDGGGNGGGGYNPVKPDSDLPTVFETAPTFNKNTNDIYTYNSNSTNVAADLPTNATYFVSITNKSSNSLSISLISSVSASIRASVRNEPQLSVLGDFAYFYRQQERDEAEVQFRKNFINSSKQKSKRDVICSVRAGLDGVDHSYEIVGNSYDLMVTDLNGKSHLLNGCKLVAETEHAKFFIDQNSRGSYSPHKDVMESFVKDGPFALTRVFDSDTVNIYKFMDEKFGEMYDVDNDGKLSVIITPYLSYLSSSLLGLYLNYCMKVIMLLVIMS